jgi:hypothetical protein
MRNLELRRVPFICQAGNLAAPSKPKKITDNFLFSKWHQKATSQIVFIFQMSRVQKYCNWVRIH